MTGTNHGMTGAVIALLIKEPVLAVPLSFCSHFACDAIPHYSDLKDKLFSHKFTTILIVDFIVAVSLMIVLGVLFPAQKWLIWACMIAAASPDLMWAYYYLYIEHIKKRKPKFNALARFHIWIQWSTTPRNAIIEAAWFIFMGLIILSRR